MVLLPSDIVALTFTRMLKNPCERCHSEPFTVIPSEARNLALEINALRDSSSPAAPRNDRLDGFFSILLGRRYNWLIAMLRYSPPSS
jgi:hypothetical protein